MLRPASFVAILLGLAACAERYDPLAGLAEDERALVTVIQRDGAVELRRTEREADGSLTVATRQGDTLVRYRIARDAQGVAGLARIPDRSAPGLAIEPPAQPGPHPERL